MKFVSFVWHILGKAIEYFAVFCAIADFVCIVFLDKYKAIVVLISIIIFLIAILARLFYFLNTYLKNRIPNGFKNLATNVRYYTNDGNIIIFETHKYIVCKEIIKYEYEHEYSWSGTRQPTHRDITTQTMGDIKNVPTNPGEWDKVILKFKKPLVYNDFSIVHIKMQLDDTDHQSKTQIGLRVDESLQLIQLDAELKYKSQNGNNIPDAKLVKKKMGLEVEVADTIIRPVPFDILTSSYRATEYDPEPGYSYKLIWER